MAGSGTTFEKRQKEMARAEKQREKAAKRIARKNQVNEPEPEKAPEEEVVPSA